MSKSQTPGASWRLFLFTVVLCLTGVSAALASNEVTRGTLRLAGEQAGVDVTLVSSDVNITVSGPVARTVLTQHFRNPSSQWSEGVYVFPLPPDAAVDRLLMNVGERVIEGEIQEKQEAKATYQAARAAGKRATLVEQDRPNLFTTSVANIPPHGDITVTIEYQQKVNWRDGKFGLHFPMAITPRYSPFQIPTDEVYKVDELVDGWLILPGERPHQLNLAAQDYPTQTANITVVLNPGFELAQVTSRSHAIVQSELEPGRTEIRLADAEVPADRDFLLSWRPAEGRLPQASFFSESSELGGFGLLSVLPPSQQDWAAPPREVVFVIDTSGSMAGQSIVAARRALVESLKSLRPEDAFNIVEFDHEASALFTQPYPAENYALAHAIRFIRSLEADGGTEIEAAFDLTLALPTDAQKLRQIIFITDGSVSNESELIAKINRELEDRRLFTVGIGSSPNRYFMEEAARAGRGTFSYIANVSDVEDEIGRLLDKLSRPALTDITIEGEGFTDLTPSRIPDLYFGEPLSVALRLLQNDSEVRISGRLVDTAWSQNLAIKAVGASSGIRINWAREMIAQWNRAGIRGVPKEQVREAVLDLALNHHLVSDFTSLVAVDKTPVRSVTIPLRRDDIAPPMPYGLKVSMPQTALGYERNVMYALMLLLLGCCFLWAARRDVAYAKV